MSMKEELAVVLRKELGEEVFDILEVPPDDNLGDVALPCFSLAKKWRKSPQAIADDVAGRVKASFLDKVVVVGAYVNFFVKKEYVAEHILEEILAKKEKFGSQQIRKEKIVIEYPSPNTNKPLHLGHLRNIFLAQAVANLLRFCGNKIIHVNLNNDRGVHICKSMYAYQKFGNNKQPDKKTDHFVGDFYVLYSKQVPEGGESEIQEMLQKWESGDRQVLALWKKMNDWAMQGFAETYARLEVKHDKTYNEHEFYDKGKALVAAGLKKGVFYRNDEGAVEVDLEKYGLGKKVLLRPDGTSIYITQDMYLAKKKFDDFKMDRSLYVVGSEQNHHFKVLFKILELLGMPFAEKCVHLSYGMVHLPEGRMKSREGTVVDADDILDEVEGLALEEIEKRHKLSKEEAVSRAKSIGQGALRFFVLKFDPAKDMVYNPRESLSFEGETGPYVQYTHARICSILRKVNEKLKKVDCAIYGDEEIVLLKMLGRFPEVVKDAAVHYKPSVVAHYVIKLCQEFNTFYTQCPVLKAEPKLRNARLVLIDAVRLVVKNSLALVQMDAPEEM